MSIQNVTDLEREMYMKWYDAYQLMLPIDIKTAKILYLKTSMDECMRRLAKRSRDGSQRSLHGVSDQTAACA